MCACSVFWRIGVPIFLCLGVCFFSAGFLCAIEFCGSLLLYLCLHAFLCSVCMNVLLCLLQLSCVFVCTVYWCVCVITVTMADSPDWYNQTTVNLAALHVSPEPKTGHKPSSPYPWAATLTRPTQQELIAPVHPRQAMIANCFSPPLCLPPFLFSSLSPSLPPIILQSLYRTKASEGHSIWMAAILAQRVLHKSVNLHIRTCVSICVCTNAPFKISKRCLITVSLFHETL